MKLLLSMIIVFTMTGCASIPGQSYIIVGAGVQVNETSLPNLCNSHGCNKSSPYTASFEIGKKFEFKSQTYRVGICHTSKILHGWPFNDNAEYYSDRVCVSVELEF